MSEIITCPSGLSGRIRGLKVREERILADRKLARNGGQTDQLLKACWTETIDPGPYSLTDARLNWCEVLQGDRFYALLRIRTLTYGSEYAFTVVCDNAACRARIEWALPLHDLPVRRLEGERLEHFVTGNRFEMTLPDTNRRVWFRLLTGREEKRLPALRRKSPERMLSALLTLRIIEVEGVEDRQRRAFFDELSMGDADALLDAFDQAECGVETTIEIECPECYAQQDIELPFERTFLMPGRGRERRRRGRR